VRSDGILIPGDILLDKYRVERVLGVGGMGYVVEALHTELRQQVAIKVLNPDLREDEEAVGRFLREARASVKIRGQHGVRVIDVGTFPVVGPFMIMEFLSGVDLSQELEKLGKLPVETAIDYILQASEAIAEAHSLGIVHRDLKPANLFLCQGPDQSPLIKVLDFGISKGLTLAHDWPELTGNQTILGSPQYMSPEQVKNPKDVDTRSDIWSLGVLLWELLTGTPPFSGLSPLSLFSAIVSEQPRELSELRRDLPPNLQAVVARCLEKSPQNRYQTIAEFASALLPFARPSGRHSVARISKILRSNSSSRPAHDTLKSALSDAALETAADTAAFVSPKDAVSSISAPQLSGPISRSEDSMAPQASTAATPRTPTFRRKAVLVAVAAGLCLVGYLVFTGRPGEAPHVGAVPTKAELVPESAAGAPSNRGVAVTPVDPPTNNSTTADTSAPISTSSPQITPQGSRSPTRNAPPHPSSRLPSTGALGPSAPKNGTSKPPLGPNVDPLDGRH